MTNVKIDPEQIPDAVYDVGCRILNKSAKMFFELPGVREDYEKWLAEYERSKEGAAYG